MEDDIQYQSAVGANALEDQVEIQGRKGSSGNDQAGQEMDVDTSHSEHTHQQQESKWESLVSIFKPLMESRSSISSSWKTMRRSTFSPHSSKMWSASSSRPTGQDDVASVISEPGVIDGDLVKEQKSQASSIVSARSAEIARPPSRALTISAHAIKAKTRLREAVDKIKKFSLPRDLLTKKQKAGDRGELAKQQNELSLMQVGLSPFRSRYIKRDAYNVSVPCILAMLSLKISDNEDDGVDYSQNVVRINLSYGPVQWSIVRSFNDLYRLHTQLRLNHLKHPKSYPGVPNFPSQVNYAFEKAKAYTYQNARRETRDVYLLRLRNKRRKALQDYLAKLMARYRLCNVVEIFQFLEISSSITTSGWKGKECMVNKGRRGVQLKFCCIPTLVQGRQVWLCVKDSYLAYYDQIDSRYPSEVVPYDSSASLYQMQQHSMNPFHFKTFVLSNEARNLIVRADTDKQFKELVTDIAFSIDKSLWSKGHRFNSFAPVRDHVQCRLFVDGKDYFEAVYKSISSAKSVIYIEDWWMSPEIYLKRPSNLYPDARLDKLLLKKAKEGVLIYVILYKEVTYALTINSAHSKATLSGLHPNIKVLRYPDHIPGGVYYWALHDKMCIVDENVAFLGGLDLCMGRFDDRSHCVGDFISSDDNGGDGSQFPIWPGQDYSNPRVKDFVDVHNYDMLLVDKKECARMPWHDVACSLSGQSAKDVARHFVQRWNFIKFQKSKERDDIVYLLPPSEDNFPMSQRHDYSSIGTSEIQVLRSCCEWSMGVKREQSIYEAYISLIENAKHFIYIENQFFISSALEDAQSGVIRNRIALAIGKKILQAHEAGAEFKVYIIVPLLPAFENDVAEGMTTRLIFHWHQSTFRKGEGSLLEFLLRKGVDPDQYLSVCSLRNYGRLGVGPSIDPTTTTQQNQSASASTLGLVTEQIYIHSKVMIVDDDWAIVGSANINDRSLAGSRDAEVAIVITDSSKVKVQLGESASVSCSKSVRDLRLQLFQEHSGLSFEYLASNFPSQDALFSMWKDIAESNTNLYRQLFSCIPDDYIQTWSEYDKWKSISTKDRLAGHLIVQETPEKTEEMLNRIHGHLVQYPSRFMYQEDLRTIPLPAKEAMISMDVFI
ncbi:hypothetical protein MIR68_009591 [Amoeboaphelidium protococcarum]|nr:hypothetical protein MIR68_009591 [Amoeboaphelidium protococcarum]